MELKNFIKSSIRKHLNENFKPMKIDDDIKGWILDWKQITINGTQFNFMRLNGSDKNKFVILMDVIWII